MLSKSVLRDMLYIPCKKTTAKIDPVVIRFKKLCCSLRNISQYLQCKIFLIFRALMLVQFFCQDRQGNVITRDKAQLFFFFSSKDFQQIFFE